MRNNLKFLLFFLCILMLGRNPSPVGQTLDQTCETGYQSTQNGIVCLVPSCSSNTYILGGVTCQNDFCCLQKLGWSFPNTVVCECRECVLNNILSEDCRETL